MDYLCDYDVRVSKILISTIDIVVNYPVYQRYLIFKTFNLVLTRREYAAHVHIIDYKKSIDQNIYRTKKNCHFSFK